MLGPWGIFTQLGIFLQRGIFNKRGIFTQAISHASSLALLLNVLLHPVLGSRTSSPLFISSATRTFTLACMQAAAAQHTATPGGVY